MASFNRKLKKQQEKINNLNTKNAAALENKNKELAQKYLTEINLTRISQTVKTISIKDKVFLENLDKFLKNFEIMGKEGKADYDEGKAQLAFIGIRDILQTKTMSTTTLRYLMLLIIFQLWDIATFHNSDEFVEACEDSNLKLLQSGFWSDNLYIIKFINSYFNFTFSNSGAFELKIR